MDIKIDELKRTKRKTISLQIKADGRLIVHAPLLAAKSIILKAVTEKSSWIIEKQQAMLKKLRENSPKAYNAGEILLYRGQPITLEYSEQVNEVELKGNNLFVPKKYYGAAKQEVEWWYQVQAANDINIMLKHCVKLLGFTYKSAKLSNASTHWGSCGPNNTLNFGWRLVMAPPEVLNYVVLHELCHTVHHNHSAAFWQKVAQLMPDYEVHRSWLKENGHKLSL
jgi:predicted metal-dependent hydrolase